MREGIPDLSGAVGPSARQALAVVGNDTDPHGTVTFTFAAGSPHGARTVELIPQVLNAGRDVWAQVKVWRAGRHGTKVETTRMLRVSELDSALPTFLLGLGPAPLEDGDAP